MSWPDDERAQSMVVALTVGFPGKNRPKIGQHWLGHSRMHPCKKGSCYVHVHACDRIQRLQTHHLQSTSARRENHGLRSTEPCSTLPPPFLSSPPTAPALPTVVNLLSLLSSLFLLRTPLSLPVNLSPSWSASGSAGWQASVRSTATTDVQLIDTFTSLINLVVHDLTDHASIADQEPWPDLTRSGWSAFNPTHSCLINQITLLWSVWSLSSNASFEPWPKSLLRK